MILLAELIEADGAVTLLRLPATFASSSFSTMSFRDLCMIADDAAVTS